jgi:hypothetical protein
MPLEGGSKLPSISSPAATSARAHGLRVLERAQIDRASVRRALLWLRTPGGGALLLTLAFITISIWWLLVDGRVPDGDQGRHLGFVFKFQFLLDHGAELGPFRFEPVDGALYPPLVYLIGVVGLWVFGNSVDSPVIALNLLLVPLLAISVYRMGVIAYNRLTGMLALAFVFASPMVISQFHVFLLDLPETAFVAGSAWLLFESDRFARTWVSAAAGAMIGLGMLTKPTFIFFIAPVAAMMVLRGGFRSWKNVGLLLGVAAIIGVPWYIEHFDRLRGVVYEASSPSQNPYGTASAPTSFENWAWYGWNFVNLQVLLPLTVFYAIGLVWAAVGWLRARSRDSYIPELIAGALGGFLVIALVFHYQDPRYTIPGIPFVAILGTAWITQLRLRALRIALAAVVIGLLLLETIAVNLGVLSPVRITVPDVKQRSVALEGKLTVIDNFGYFDGKPDQTSHLFDRLKSARRDGVRTMSYEESPPLPLNPSGLYLYAGQANLKTISPVDYNKKGHPRRGADGIYLVYRAPGAPGGWPRPCSRFVEGGGLFIFRGDPGVIDRTTLQLTRPNFRHLYCPAA